MNRLEPMDVNIHEYLLTIYYFRASQMTFIIFAVNSTIYYLTPNNSRSQYSKEWHSFSSIWERYWPNFTQVLANLTNLATYQFIFKEETDHIYMLNEKKEAGWKEWLHQGHGDWSLPPGDKKQKPASMVPRWRLHFETILYRKEIAR